MSCRASLSGVPVALPIETERLEVRPFDPAADSLSMLSVYGDPDVMRFIPGGELADIKAVRKLLDEYARAQRSQGFSSWGIVERESGSLIGDVGFGIFEPTGEIELGFTLARSYWGPWVRDRVCERLPGCGLGSASR
jgi:ribosomal-protein-alanine N-acetyltransferase